MTNCTRRAVSRRVSGMPAAAAAAEAEVTPGTISKPMPAALQRVDFLFQPAEHAGIAGFQPHHPRAGLGVIHQQAADMILLGRGAAGAFAHATRSAPDARQSQDRPGRQVVEQHRIGGLQPLRRP